MAPLIAGPAFAGALDSRTASFRVSVTIALWVIWAATLAAVLVPRDLTLTVIRIVIPASVPAAAWVAAAGASAPTGLAAIALSVAAAAVAVAPATTDLFVDGSSYGPERRLALRTPTPLLAGPLELAWVAVVAGSTAGPLLLAAHRWVLGGIVLVLGWPLAAAGARALHGLSRRWVVLVPAGLVLHDPLSVDALLFPRNTIARLGPAPADADTRRVAEPTMADLTGGALGLVLQLDLVEPVPLAEPTTRRPFRRPAEPTAPGAPTVAVDRLLFTPVRPASLLEVAAAHRIPVGP